VGQASSHSVKINFARRALQEIDRNARWWREHRPAARMLFDEELAEALKQIRTNPGLGQLYRVVRGRQQRRVLMPKTKHHVYYRRETAERIMVLSVWSAVRGRGPRLR